MTDTPSYLASPIKRRRATKAEVEGRRDALHEIVSEMSPMTVRQVFYQATVRGIVEKSEAGYTKVQTDLVLMRRSGDLPYDWLADNTRWQRKPSSYDSVQEALNETARLYRKSLWRDVDASIQQHLPADQFKVLMAAEESERQLLTAWANSSPPAAAE
jgi:hypothetical protein